MAYSSVSQHRKESSPPPYHTRATLVVTRTQLHVQALDRMSVNQMSDQGAPKRVSFSDGADQIGEVLSHTDYTDAEYEASWRTVEEERASQAELVQTLLLARNHQGTIPQNLLQRLQLTTRGIESLCAEGSHQELLSSKELHMDAVLLAQETSLRNDEAVTECQEAIKRASLSHSEEASNKAIRQGTMDAAFVTYMYNM